MTVAKELVAAQRYKRSMETNVALAKKDIERLEAEHLANIEDERIPASATVDGMSLAIKSQWWAGPTDGDHARLCVILQELGMNDLLPSSVNSQKLSGFVREYIDRDTGELIVGEDGVAPELAEVIKVTERVSVQATER